MVRGPSPDFSTDVRDPLTAGRGGGVWLTWSVSNISSPCSVGERRFAGCRASSSQSREENRMSNLGARISAQVTALEPRINSDGIVAWGVKNIIPIVMLFIGI